MRTDSIFQYENKSDLKFLYISSYSLSIITFITFAFAMIAIPISGANAVDGGIPYPYLDTVGQYPRDYIWQYLAMFMLCVYLINMLAINKTINNGNPIYKQTALIFAAMSTLVLLIDYYVHVSVVPISLMSGEHQGIPLLIQYNPHGVFIALEELGYILMVISFAFLIPVFKASQTKSIMIFYGIAVIVSVLSFIFISIVYGLNKLDRFEVVIISATWLVLIINGVMLGNRARGEFRI